MISARLRQNRNPVRRGRKRDAASHGMSSLIPMIDMLTILVVYLLVHAADYEILPNTRSIQIPQSMSETKPRETVTVLITKEALFVNGAELASVAELRARPEAVIEPLRRVLRTEAEQAPAEGQGRPDLARGHGARGQGPPVQLPEEDPVDLHGGGIRQGLARGDRARARVPRPGRGLRKPS